MMDPQNPTTPTSSPSSSPTSYKATVAAIPRTEKGMYSSGTSCSTRPASRAGRPLPGFPTSRGRMLKESSTRIIYLLALLAIESHGPFLSSSNKSGGHNNTGQSQRRRLTKEEARLEVARQERLLVYVDSLSDVLALEDDTALRAMVAAACQDGGLVSQPHQQEQSTVCSRSSSSSSSKEEAEAEPEQDDDCYVLVRTVPELVEELLAEVKASCPSPLDSAWLSLIMKVLITYQVRANLYDARARASFRRLSQRLGPDLLPWAEVVAIEGALAAEYTALLSDSQADPPSCQSVGRYVKVACAALGGGALMMFTGSVAAPSIAASLLALCTAGGLGMGPATAAITQQLTSGTTALLSYWGLTSDVCISSVLAVTGVGVTGYKMTQRTRGITEFHFVPLHSSFPIDRHARSRRQKQRRRQQGEGEEVLKREEDEGPEEGEVEKLATSSYHESCSRSSSKSHKSINDCGGGGTGAGGLPVFVCIPGWVEEDQDPRRVWGGATTTLAAGAGTVTVEEEEAAAAAAETWEAEMVDAMVGEEGGEEGSPMGKSGMSDGSSSSSLSMSSWEAVQVETSGWWREVVPGGEEHVLIWETALLGQLHRAMREFMWHEASRYALDEVIKHTALAGLTTAAALPLSVLTAAQKLDNPWQLAVFHAQEAGQLLADVLVARPQGSRPVTLLGFSMGARVVFHCLEALAAKGEDGLGIVENAVLLGLPFGRASERWGTARAVVAGRLINGYSTKDWVLQFLFRSKAWELGLAGVGPVMLEGGREVENVDLTEMVAGHLAYPKALPNIMALLRLEE